MARPPHQHLLRLGLHLVPGKKVPLCPQPDSQDSCFQPHVGQQGKQARSGRRKEVQGA